MIQRLKDELNQRSIDGSLRSLVNYNGLVDFASNDYLGFCKSNVVAEEANYIHDNSTNGQSPQNGSGGSRLLTGNSDFYLEAEKEMALFFKSDGALTYTSGYAANLGLLSAILKRNDNVFYDEYSHSSIKDGIRLGYAKSIKFLHNNLEDLENKLLRASGEKFVVVESLYSMDGDFAPLQELCELCTKQHAHLIVDEAHASGVYGPNGEGLVVQHGLEKSVFARIHTFGKGLGSHGALVAGSNDLVDYLINFSRPFIYTTALPAYNVAAMLAGIRLSSKAKNERVSLFSNINHFRETAQNLGLNIMNSSSQIQGLVVPGNKQIVDLSESLRELNIDVRAIKSPTVPAGKERLRICLHTYNTKEEIEILLNGIHDHLNE